jgi:signal transduction histidine kinase
MKSTAELALIATIADELPAGVWVATVPDGRFAYSNRAFEEVMGMGPVTDVGAGEYAAPYGIYTREGSLYPEDRLPFVRAVQAQTTVVVDDLVIHRHDGRRVYVRAFAKPLFDEHNRMTHVAIAFFDITREAEAQAKLAQAERLASIGMLAAGIADEVNDPLSYLVGSLDLITRETSAEMLATDARLRLIDERVRDARQGAELVRSIVGDLKAFARVKDARPSAVDVRAAIEAALRLAQVEIRPRARVTRDLRPVPVVWGEEGHVGQLFLNLLVHVARAIVDGDPERDEIRVTTRTDSQGWIEVEMTDTGPEATPDPARAAKPEADGAGLGLVMCQSLAADLGGRIEVRGEPGKGGTMRVLLPPASQRTAPSPVPQGSRGTPARKRATVLVVDDEPLILKVVAQILGVEHDVTCESSASAALERFRNGQRFDVVLCDLMMPQLTGIDLYDALLEIAPKQAQTMLFLTGGAFTARAQAFLDRVPNAAIEKPFNQATLVSRVRQLLAKY